jgi:ABC-type enterochelin transport system ATPase subunit
MSQLVSEPYEYNTTLTTIFFKTYSENMLQCPDKDYISLDRWQANKDLHFVFTFCNLLFATAHLRQGKKASIIVSGDVNFGPVVSRRGLLEAVPIVRRG